jgi:hypothetical protein
MSSAEKKEGSGAEKGSKATKAKSRNAKVSEQDQEKVSEGAGPGDVPKPSTPQIAEPNAAKEKAVEDTKPSPSETKKEALPEDHVSKAKVDSEETADEESSQFARIKKGWEIFVAEQAQNVHRASQNESIQQLLCGAGQGFARITGQPYIRGSQASEDPFEPIILRHTRSSPLQYSASMFGEGETEQDLPPPIGLEHMRRSSSTPTAFRQSSIGSAFGAVPHFPVHGGERGAYYPAQRDSFTSRSDSGIRYSAFDPFMMERTSIEVTDLGQAAAGEEGSPRKSRGARVAKLLMRRRKRRGGRDNPARPPSSSSASLKEGSVNVSISVDEEPEPMSEPTDKKPPAVSAEKSSPQKETIGIPRPSSRASGRASIPSVPEIDTEEEGEEVAESPAKEGGNNAPSPQYQQLDSDVDEEYEHMMRLEGIEAAMQSDSPSATPSPYYHHFVDEASGRLSRPSPVESSIPGVRLQVATASPPPSIAEHAEQESISRTPLSQDSNQSPTTTRSSGTGTSRSSGQTSTSATASSSHASALSSVSETDIEVMQTNVAEKHRLQQQQRQLQDSIASASTTSSTTTGYLALGGSPASLRDGAALETDHFFRENRIPVAHSASSNSNSTGSSGSGSRGEGSGMGRGSPVKKSAASPLTESSVANTSSSSSADEEPPKLASYIDRKSIAQSGEASLPSVSEEGSGRGKVSPANIVGYSDMMFEEAKMPASTEKKQAKLFRPVHKRAGDRFNRLGSRPPLSPAKGLRTPTTPPPASYGAITDSTSPAYHQLSPPRNIIDHSTSEDLSKPYPMFGAGSRSLGESRKEAVVVSPENSSAARRTSSLDERGENWAQEVVVGDDGKPAYTYSEAVQASDKTLTYEESNIEVKKSSEKESDRSTNIVSPDKATS